MVLVLASLLSSKLQIKHNISPSIGVRLGNI